jgi:hypothetical protein
MVWQAERFSRHTVRVERSPAVRASVVRDTLAYLDKFEPGAQQRVLDRVPPTSRDVIAHTPRSSWIPIEHDHWTIDAMIEIFGRPRAIECWRDSLADLIERPLLRNFVAGMLVVMGRDPVRLIGLLVKGWSLVYRDLCAPQLSTTKQGEPVIQFCDIAPQVRAHPNYLSSWDGACQGFAALTQVRASVVFTAAPDCSSAEAKFSWL